MKSIFEFSEYKQFLGEVEASRASIQRGFRSRLAEAIGCQAPFITQVLNSSAHFSLEQAIRCARFVGLNAGEERFFLLMIQHSRAGNRELTQFFENEMQIMRDEYLDISKRVKVDVVLGEEAKTQYYSHWYYSAIHVLVTIPKFRDIDSIAQALGLTRLQIQNALLFLTTHGLVEEKNGTFVPGSTQLHLGKKSPHVFQHHQNWRLKTLDTLGSDAYEQNLHYSTVSSLSEKDAEKIRAMMLQVIEDYVEKVKPSKEETLYAFTLDFFKLLK